MRIVNFLIKNMIFKANENGVSKEVVQDTE